MKIIFEDTKYGKSYNKLFGNFWQRLKMGTVRLSGEDHPSLDYLRQFIKNVAIYKENFDRFKKADLFYMKYNQDHIRQIAVIALIDIINMNDDRLWIDEYFLAPQGGYYHGNLFLGKDLSEIIPWNLIMDMLVNL